MRKVITLRSYRADRSLAATADANLRSPRGGTTGTTCGGSPGRIALRPRPPAACDPRPTATALPVPNAVPTWPATLPAPDPGCASAPRKPRRYWSRTGRMRHDPAQRPGPAGNPDQSAASIDARRSRSKTSVAAEPGLPSDTTGKDVGRSRATLPRFPVRHGPLLPDTSADASLPSIAG